MTANLTATQSKAYDQAGATAEEVFSSIRTVVSYNGQDREQKRFVELHLIHAATDKIHPMHIGWFHNDFLLLRYEKHLSVAQRYGIKRGAMVGLTMGIVWFVIYNMYALGIKPLQRTYEGFIPY